jgi:hypothetical protein
MNNAQIFQKSGRHLQTLGSRKVTRIKLHIEDEQFWVKVKVKFTLEEAMKAQRGSRGIAVHFL